jgi:hypothetical protein
MKLTLQDTKLLIEVINRELDITRLKINNTNDILEKSHLVNLQSLRNDFENHFFDQVIDKEEEEQ